MLSERDYSNRTQEERMSDSRGSYKNKEKKSRNDELWRLYGKEHKSFIDKIKIKMIERKNIREANK